MANEITINIVANALKKALLAAKMDGNWPTLTKNKEGRFKYADLIHMLKLYEPVLGKHGLVVNFEAKVRNEIEVSSAVLSHPESNTEITSEAIIHPGKDVKEWGGNKTYIKRYCLLDVLGIAVSDDFDPDSEKVLTPDQVKKIQDAIKACGTWASTVHKAILSHGKVAAIEDIYQDGFEEVMMFIAAEKNKRI
jgi:hypothetical protein